MTPLLPMLRERKVLCVVGPGGVGKTTTAAALGVAAAYAGRRPLVVTIDPARRLAGAMGLTALGQIARPVRLPPREAGAREFIVQAMMLDLKAAWDDMVRRLARDEQQRRAILANRYYHTLSTSLAGAQEYIACEQLYELCSQQTHDLIILDTPPSAHAIDFLEAPGRILDALEGEGLRWLLTPARALGHVSRRAFDLGGRYVLGTLSRLVGSDMLLSLGEFLSAFEEMYPALRDRTLGFREIFASSATAFLVVTTPNRHALHEASTLCDRLVDDGLAIGGLIVNQVHHVPAAADAATLQHVLSQACDPPQAERLVGAVERSSARARRRAAAERVVVEAALRTMPALPVVEVPRQDADIHDIKSLVTLADQLVGRSPPATA